MCTQLADKADVNNLYRCMCLVVDCYVYMPANKRIKPVNGFTEAARTGPAYSMLHLYLKIMRKKYFFCCC